MKDQSSTRNQYLTDIIIALGLEVDTFWEALLRKEQYAIVVYLWIDKLYAKGSSMREAKCLLFKARNIYYHKKTRQQYGTTFKTNL